MALPEALPGHVPRPTSVGLWELLVPNTSVREYGDLASSSHFTICHSGDGSDSSDLALAG